MSDQSPPPTAFDPGAGIAVRRRRSARGGGRPADTPAALPALAVPMGIEPARRMETTPRRRRSLRRRARRVGVMTQVVVALLCWAGFLLVIYATSPDNAAACAAFFLLLFGAVAFTVMPVLRVLTRRFSRSRLFQERSGMIAARQSVMLAAFLVLNAMLQMLRAWTGLVALLLFGMFAVIEVVALARR